jgi:hypothetical protein
MSVKVRSIEEHDDWVRDEETDANGTIHWQRSPYAHVVTLEDGSQVFALGWCEECQSWEKRDPYAPHTHRFMLQLSVPVTGGWHQLLDSKPVEARLT